MQHGAFHAVVVYERLHHKSSCEDADDAEHVDLRAGGEAWRRERRLVALGGTVDKQTQGRVRNGRGLCGGRTPKVKPCGQACKFSAAPARGVRKSRWDGGGSLKKASYTPTKASSTTAHLRDTRGSYACVRAEQQRVYKRKRRRRGAQSWKRAPHACVGCTTPLPRTKSRARSSSLSWVAVGRQNRYASADQTPPWPALEQALLPGSRRQRHTNHSLRNRSAQSTTGQRAW